MMPPDEYLVFYSWRITTGKVVLSRAWQSAFLLILLPQAERSRLHFPHLLIPYDCFLLAETNIS